MLLSVRHKTLLVRRARFSLAQTQTPAVGRLVKVCQYLRSKEALLTSGVFREDDGGCEVWELLFSRLQSCSPEPRQVQEVWHVYGQIC